MFTKLFIKSFLLFAILNISLASLAVATTESGAVPEKVAIIEKLGDQLNPNITFKDESGKDVKLGDYLGQGKPIILTPVYYNCPNLCTYTLNGLLEVLDQMSLKIGEDFTILSFSINPKETPELAAKKKKAYIKELKPLHDGETGWHFLTGADDQIKELTKAIGFQYFPDKKEFAHSAALIVLTEGGVVSRYLYGIKFPEENVRLSLVEAGEGKIGSAFDHIFLYCFSFDDTSGQYTLAVMNLVRIVSLAFLFWLIIYLRRVYKRSENSRASKE